MVMKNTIKDDPTNIRDSKKYNDVFRNKENEHHWEQRLLSIRDAYKMHATLRDWYELLPKEHTFFAGWE